MINQAANLQSAQDLTGTWSGGCAVWYQEPGRNLGRVQALQWTEAGSLGTASTDSAAPSNTRRRRNHVLKTVDKPYAETANTN
jgi:hypothetical protein